MPTLGGETVGHARRAGGGGRGGGVRDVAPSSPFLMSVRLPSFHAPQGTLTPVPTAKDFKKGDQVRVSNGPCARGYKVEAYDAFLYDTKEMTRVL